MMKNKIHIFAFLFTLVTIICACDKDKPFDTPFVYFNLDTQASGPTVVSKDADVINQYMVHLSKVYNGNRVDVEITALPGDGLVPGTDYELVSSRTLMFLPGIYELAFRVRWKPHAIDKQKDNSLTLVIDKCSDPTVNLGYPGPASSRKQIKIIKQ